MKCTTVRTKLAGYLDDALTGTTSAAERVQIGQHLNGCTVCRAELERFRKLSVLLSRTPKNVPPADLAVRIKVAAAQAQHSQDWSSRLRKMRDRAEILLDHVLRPLTVPATGGVFSAVVVFALVLQLMAPGITVQAVANDVPLDIRSMPAAKWWTTKFFPVPRAPLCVISSTRFFSSRVSVRC
jgi:anti-sigma factor RsiW